MTDGNAIRIVQGNCAVDDRGSLGFINEFEFPPGIKRFYFVQNHKAGFVRAWHGHKNERKFVTVLKGAAVIGVVTIDDWDNPSPSLKPERFVLSGVKPAVLCIPPGCANGAMTLTDDAIIVYFSSSSVEESHSDDFRFDARFWDIWSVQER
jgi:dTDP-4-dehydrorhamnose 3,5-epimerase-like enzyme